MEPYGQNPATDGARADPSTGLEESMWQMGLGGGGLMSYPERPGEPDCAYYLRTGTCGYGERCRYNHPLDRSVLAGAVRSGSVEYPERAGQPACQYFLKTGTCKYGATCKYDHPRQGGLTRPVSLNYLGYPLRLGEKECSYYVRTGQCKFGSTCKFHHPEFGSSSVPSSPPAFYPVVQSPSLPSPHQYPGVDVPRPSVLPASYTYGPYGALLVSPGVVPVPGWTPYLSSVGPAASPGGQHSIQAGPLYGSSNQLSPSAPAYQGAYLSMLSTAGPSGSTQKEHIYPEKPGQPECQYYMRTGDCKFGSTCKYNHPPHRTIPDSSCILSPVGLPLRPGAPACIFYAQHGICKFGPTCKFDHPMGTLNYSPSASSLADMPVAPYPVGFSMGTLAPSSSSLELRPEFISNTDAFSAQMPSSEGTPSGSIGSMFSMGGYVPHSLTQLSGQISATSSGSSGGSSMGRGGKISSSR